MDLLIYILLLGLSGLVVGALGRLLMPGPDPMSIWSTVLVGIGGSLLAGIVVRLIFGPNAIPGLIASVVAATLIVWIIRRTRRDARPRRGDAMYHG